MAIVSIRGERGIEKWKIRPLSTPATFTIRDLLSVLTGRRPSWRPSWLIGFEDDAVVTITKIDPSVTRPDGTIGLVEYTISGPGGSSSGGMNIISPITGTDKSSVMVEIPGYIERLRGAGTNVQKSSSGSPWYTEPIVLVGAAVAIGVGLFLMKRRDV